MEKYILLSKVLNFGNRKIWRGQIWWVQGMLKGWQLFFSYRQAEQNCIVSAQKSTATLKLWPFFVVQSCNFVKNFNYDVLTISYGKRSQPFHISVITRQLYDLSSTSSLLAENFLCHSNTSSIWLGDFWLLPPSRWELRSSRLLYSG